MIGYNPLVDLTALFREVDKKTKENQEKQVVWDDIDYTIEELESMVKSPLTEEDRLFAVEELRKRKA